MLVIDDECDYASVNTRKLILDENGHVDEECDPAKTNMRIRELLNAFGKSAYVGYTATPFANIFIHHDLKHAKFGEDLFPKNFIISLPQPTNYVGPERVFGLIEHNTAGIREQDPALLVQWVDDNNERIPSRHTKDLQIDDLPESLKEAIMAFILSCAVRKLRECSPYHDSMLIHVTRFNSVQDQIQVCVERVLRCYVDRIRSGSDPLRDFQMLWENNFIPITESMLDEIGVVSCSWRDIVHNIYSVARRIKVKLINGTSEDSLAYRNAEMMTRKKIIQGEEVPWEERGEHIIAIGGDKLSRGLTLDGLTVSYYLRASKMYDTLMQMGRWFGYRDGYLDVCRIYTTEELAGWYRFIASASVELRKELDYMALINAEPKEFGLKVLDHPGQLAITSAGKRRNAEALDLSYSGRISETVVFDLRHSENNLLALSNLLTDVMAKGEPGLKACDGMFHWRRVLPDIIVRYLRLYRTQEEAARVVDPKKIAQFIEEQQIYGKGDLKEWDVVIVSKKDESRHSLKHLTAPDKPIRCLERKPLTLSENTLTIRRLISPSDEWADFEEAEKDHARNIWAELLAKRGRALPESNIIPSGPAIRSARPKERGLLLIYPICYNDKIYGSYGIEAGKEVTGFAISFPASETTHQVKYQVNSVFQDAED